MAVKHIEIPHQNPIPFRDDQHPYKDLPGVIHNEDSFYNKLNSWEIKKGYAYPATFWDYIGIQIQVAGQYLASFQIGAPTALMRLEVLDCNDKVVGTRSPSFRNFLAGNVYKHDNGVDYMLMTVNWRFSFADMNLFKKGIYRFRLRIGYEVGAAILYDYFTSEPILLADEHPRTVVLEYISFDAMKHDVDWTNMFFHHRVYGQLRYKEFGNDTTAYEDQSRRILQQKSVAYRSIELSVGQYMGGVPDWVHDKVNRILANDLVLIQRRRYTRELDADYDTNDLGGTRYRLSTGRTMLREYSNTEGTMSTTQTPVAAFQRPATGFPYMVHKVVLRNSTSNNTVIAFVGFEINNAAQEQDFIRSLNSYKGGGTLTGYFTMVGDTCFYYNGNGEAFNSNESDILYKYTQMHFVKAFVGGTNQIKLQLTLTGKKILFAPKNYYQVYAYSAGTNTQWAFDYDYLNNGNPNTATCRIWHDDQIETIHCSSPCLADFDNAPYSPETLRTIWIANAQMTSFGTFTINAATLRDLVIGARLTDILGLDIKAWTALELFALPQNRLPIATVDRIINDLRTVAYPLKPNGWLEMGAQTPLAGVTGASAGARADFTAAGWYQNYV